MSMSGVGGGSLIFFEKMFFFFNWLLCSFSSLPPLPPPQVAKESGHKSIVHTAANSALGLMLLRASETYNLTVVCVVRGEKNEKMLVEVCRKKKTKNKKQKKENSSLPPATLTPLPFLLLFLLPFSHRNSNTPPTWLSAQMSLILKKN